MKTNESVILAHGWKKNAGVLGGHPQSYSKEINNIYITIYLSKNGNYWLSISNYVNLLNNLDTYMAVAEELKLLNIETANSKDKDSVYDLLDSLESDLSHINNYEEFKLDLPYLLGWLKHIRDICKEQNM